MKIHKNPPFNNQEKAGVGQCLPSLIPCLRTESLNEINRLVYIAYTRLFSSDPRLFPWTTNRERQHPTFVET